jgi:hypothetical protein
MEQQAIEIGALLGHPVVQFDPESPFSAMPEIRAILHSQLWLKVLTSN